MRLIDADELFGMETILATAARSPESRVLMEQVLYDIQHVPTIDAVPVVHGRWVWFENRPVVDDEDPECIGITGYECSECGNSDSTCIRFYEELSVYSLSCIKEGLKESLTNYCPNCGAKMDAEEPTNE